MDDPIIPLMNAVVRGIDEALAGQGRSLPGDWESLSIVIGLEGDGGYAEAYGYAYGADDAWVQAITAAPPRLTSEVKAFVDDRYPEGAAPPVAVLLQLRLADRSYHVEFEDHDRARWQPTPQNSAVIQAELKPVFDDEADGAFRRAGVQDAVPEEPGTDTTAASEDFAVAVARQMIALPWPEDPDPEEYSTWKVEGITGSTFFGIVHHMRLGAAVARDEKALTPQRLAAFDERFGPHQVFDMDTLPAYDPAAEDLDMRVVLSTVIQNTGATRALWWQATNRRIVMAGIDKEPGGLVARLFGRSHSDAERITGIVVAPPEMLSAASPTGIGSDDLAAAPPRHAKRAVTHVERLNSMKSPLTDDRRSFPEHIRQTLHQMDGEDLWGYSLWRAPAGSDLIAAATTSESLPENEELLECAGAAESMTITWRRRDADEVAQQYTLAKADDRLEPDVTFSADEAARVFYFYFLTDTVPGEFRLLRNASSGEQDGRPVPEDTRSLPAGRAVEFADRNLKIAVLQELMDLNLLPRYEWHEHAASHGLDPEEHGTRTFGTAIPEAMAYVDAVAISPELAERVTSIKMDAGNDLYGELAFHWDGEDDLFDVRTVADLPHLPSPRSAELLYDQVHPAPALLAEIEAMRERGIDVRHWDS